MRVDVVDDGFFDIGVFLEHEEKHCSATNKGLYVGYVLFSSKRFWEKRIYGWQQLGFATSPFKERLCLSS